MESRIEEPPPQIVWSRDPINFRFKNKGSVEGRPEAPFIQPKLLLSQCYGNEDEQITEGNTTSREI